MHSSLRSTYVNRAKEKNSVRKSNLVPSSSSIPSRATRGIWEKSPKDHKGE